MRSEILNYLYLLRSILSFKGDRLGSGKEGVYVCVYIYTHTHPPHPDNKLCEVRDTLNLIMVPRAGVKCHIHAGI